MIYILAAVILLVVSGLIALLIDRAPYRSTYIAVAGNIAACVVGIIPAVSVLLKNEVLSLNLPWKIPYGSFHIEADGLSALFLLPIFFISALAAVYGGGYIASWYGKKRTGYSWFFFNLLIASMVMTVIARGAVLFLVSWEIMSVSSFFLVTFENEKQEVRSAGLTYLIATHIGAAFLFVLFILLGKSNGSFDFSAFSVQGKILPSVIFILAVIGFGTKAGFMPMHVWLPEAHPAAPSHVSAVMSGVMIKTGIYGLLRILTFTGEPAVWWGWLLVGTGLVSAVLGILFALAEEDIKRLLAFSSIENAGIIAMGIGTGIIGMALEVPVLAVLGFCGALLHVINHSMFKGLLFMSTGSLARAAGTRNMDRMGGLLKQMPLTGVCFLAGAAAVSGMPVLNGFMSEFLIFSGALNGALLQNGSAVVFFGIIAALALTGGLAAACFTKAFGIIFLGEPRESRIAGAHEAKASMLAPVIILTVCCFAVVPAAPALIYVLGGVVSGITGLPPRPSSAVLSGASGCLKYIAASAFAFSAIAAILAVIRIRLLAKRGVKKAVTWDCGYAAGSPRMQYTGSSFSQPLSGQFRFFLRSVVRVSRPRGLFPRRGELSVETPDIFRVKLYEPFSKFIRGLSAKLKWIQHGRVQYYVLYIVITLLALLFWKMGQFK
ncbi:MAG: proton-conducting transporter membrane subunit [Candidatus Omnitrophota bacterium]